MHINRSNAGGLLFFLTLFISGRVEAQSKPDTWEVFSLGKPALTVNLPGSPEPMGVTIPPAVINSIRACSAYRYFDLHSGVEVKLFYVSYSDEKLADMDSHADQILLDLENQGALNIKYKSTQLKSNKKQGVRCTGSLKINDIKEEFSITLFIEKSNVWKVMTFLKEGDKSKGEIVESILNSIAFK